MVERSRLLSSVTGRLPAGASSVGAGQFVSGVTSYGFLVIAARALGPSAYAPLAVLWTVVFLIGPGVFLPVEQEMTRRLASGAVGVRAVVGVGAVVAAVLVVGTLVASESVASALFSDERAVALALAVGIVSQFVGEVRRGLLAGAGRFEQYGWFLVTQGGLRLVAAGVLAIVSVRTAGPYAAVVALAPFLPAMVFHGGQLTDGGSWREAARALTPMLLGSLLAQGLLNAAPVALALLAPEGREADVGRFLAALLLARVPVFLFEGVQVTLLPRFARQLADGKVDALLRDLRRLLGVTVAIGAAMAALGALIGPEVLQIVFGSDYTVRRIDLALLGASTGLLLAAMALAQAHLAATRRWSVATAWGIGNATFVVVTALGNDLLLRVELGLVAGAAAAAATLLWDLRRLPAAN